MIFKRLLIPLLLSIVTFSSVVACNSGNSNQAIAPGNDNTNTANTANSIPIGAALAQTSNVALLGQEQVVGVKLAEKYFNEKGGVNGTPIKVVLQDVTGDEQGAINAFNTLITKDKVVGILGPSLSQQAFAADPIADRAKVPVIGPSNTAKGIPQIGEFVSRVSAPVSIVAPNAIKAASKINPNIKKVAIFYAQNDAYSKSETEVFQKTVKDANLDTVTVQKFQTTDTDFQNQATAGINANPDLIIISGLAADGGNLIKQLRELGYKGLIIGGNGLNTSNIFPVCQAKCDGVLIAQAYSPELETPINKSFREAYRSEKQKEPPQFTAQAFTGIQVFVEALKRVDAKNKISGLSLDALRQQLNREILAGKYQTPLGDIAFTPEGEIIQNDFYVAQVKMDADGKNGKFTFLK
ncbi:MAG: Leucine-, isoleucine-, valine-, threonine-, and alanine-binding protein [Chroococcopsis gigantea SAG 12.99]|jgi:branched-chain amino acid transport system substrate-binding protein|nr:ABC transporter substrate-binding protein [Chlorogloea purpurea SAG 13.99]MDV3001234.1 Leucine-, isoleucine-, valine-, threonine-, and alanine-binding protein [Chroococcopsis gigantea SAG 12.99]